MLQGHEARATGWRGRGGRPGVRGRGGPAMVRGAIAALSLAGPAMLLATASVAVASPPPEERIAVAGRVAILWNDPAPGEAGPSDQPRWWLHPDRGEPLELQVDAALLRQAGGALALDAAPVEIVGRRRRSGGSLQVESLIPLPRPRSTAGTAERWAALLCSFSDSPAVTAAPPRAWLTERLGAGPLGIGGRWAPALGGAPRSNGIDVGEWRRLQGSRWTYRRGRGAPATGDGFDPHAAARDCAAAAVADLPAAGVDGLLFLFDQEIGGSWAGGTSLDLGGAPRFLRAAWLGPSAMADPARLAHAMGHALGLPHSGGGSRWDLMGGAACAPGPGDECLPWPLAAVQAQRLGWLAGEAVHEALPGPSETILLVPGDDPWLGDGRYGMARIPIVGSSAEYFTVEARRGAGEPGEGIVIHRVNEARLRQPLEVVDPDGDEDPNDDGAVWTPGESFQDADHGVTVAVAAEAAGGFLVTISRDGPAAACGAQPTEAGEFQRTWGGSGRSGDTEDGHLLPGAAPGWPGTGRAVPDAAAPEALSGGPLALAAGAATLRTAPNSGSELDRPVPGEALFLHVWWEVTGTAGEGAGVRLRASVDGEPYCRIDAPATPGRWVGWCDTPWVVPEGAHRVAWEVEPIGWGGGPARSGDIAARYFPAARDLRMAAAWVVDAAAGRETATPAQGQEVVFQAEVEVLGDAGPREVVARALLDGIPLCEVRRAAAAGEPVAVSCPPWSATAGRHLLRWEVDHLQAVQETDEANNTASVTWTTGRPDIQALDAYVRRTPDLGGERVERPVGGDRLRLGLDWLARGLPGEVAAVQATLDGEEFCFCTRATPGGEPARLQMSCHREWTAVPGSHLLRWTVSASDGRVDVDPSNNTVTEVIEVAPANDECSTATVVTNFTYSNNITTTQATSPVSDPSPPCALGRTAKSVWYQFTAPGTGTLTVDTIGSNYDTVLSTWTGSCGTLAAVPGGCNDDIDEFTLLSRVSFSVVAGETYRFMVSDWDGIGGDLVLNLSFVPSLPANDTCQTAIELSSPATAAAYTASAGGLDGPTPPCGNGSKARSVWYRFTAAGPGTLNVDTFGSGYDTILSAWTGTCTTLSAVPSGCNDDSDGTAQSRLVLPVAGIETYFLMATARSGDGGSLLLGLELQPQAGEVPDGAGGAPLLLGPEPGGGITLSWDSSCMRLESDYEIYEGTLGSFASHAPLLCSTGGATSATVMPSAGSRYYLVVPQTGYFEGGYGAASSGAARAASAGACLPQSEGACAPACAHGRCVSGGALNPACDPVVSELCALDSFCCAVTWDSICVSEVRTLARNLTCPESAGACSHTLCSEGAALVSGCDSAKVSPSCTAAICAVDPDCCATGWDAACVEQVTSVCGYDCN